MKRGFMYFASDIWNHLPELNAPCNPESRPAAFDLSTRSSSELAWYLYHDVSNFVALSTIDVLIWR